MDCKEFEKKIPAFVANALDYRELKQFLAHVERCAECMARLEEGSAFDLQKELRRRMQEAEKHIRLHRMFRYIGMTMAAAALAAVLLLVVIFVL